MAVKEKINEIKNRLYEAEGLLELLALRQEKAAELLPLIRERVEDVLQSLDGCEPEVYPIPDESDSLYDSIPEEDEQVDLSNPPEDGIDLSNPPKEDEELPETQIEKEKSSRKAPAFCVGDRFRFRRVLFGGNEDEFNQAMNAVTSMSHYEEAEQYFYGNRGFEPEDDDVIEFMEIIRNYFGQ